MGGEGGKREVDISEEKSEGKIKTVWMFLRNPQRISIGLTKPSDALWRPCFLVGTRNRCCMT
jgi:hypothetical protein